MRTRTAFTLVLAGLSACRAESAPPPSDAEPGAAPADARTVSVALEDASVAEAVRALANAAQVPLVVDPEAQRVAGCARVTVLTGGPAPAAQVIRLVGEALQLSGLTLVESPAGLVLRRTPGAPLPSACAQGPAGGAPDAFGGALDGAGAATPDPAVEREIIAGIRRRSDTEFEVTARARDLLVENLPRVSRARIVPAVRDGRTLGMKLFGVRAKDVLSALGFQNGDTLVAVAGVPITGPDKALEAYAGTRGATSLPVRIERRGEVVQVTFKIVPK